MEAARVTTVGSSSTSSRWQANRFHPARRSISSSTRPIGRVEDEIDRRAGWNLLACQRELVEDDPTVVTRAASIEDDGTQRQLGLLDQPTCRCVIKAEVVPDRDGRC